MHTSTGFMDCGTVDYILLHNKNNKLRLLWLRVHTLYVMHSCLVAPFLIGGRSNPSNLRCIFLPVHRMHHAPKTLHAYRICTHNDNFFGVLESDKIQH